MGDETETYTFKKRAYWFDAAGLRTSMEQIARTFSVEIVVPGKPRSGSASSLSSP